MNIVLFGNASCQNAGIRYRLVKFAQMLTAEGHTCKVCLPSSPALWNILWNHGTRLTKLLYLLVSAIVRVLQLRHVRSADAILLRGAMMPYGLGPPFFECIIHFLNPRMIYDIDDAIWLRPDGVTSPFLRLVDYGWVRKMCGMCVHGIVGNTFLKDHVQRYNANVTVIPTCIDTDAHTAKTHENVTSPEYVILGWTGVSSNLVYMREIEDTLRRLGLRHRILLMVASDRDYQYEGIKVINQRWCLEHEIQYLKDVDIGLMPLFRTDYAKGKCAFKALQFMAVGTPCVISAVGMNTELVQDGVNGFLADSPEEWLYKLDLLITDAPLRRRLGLAARETVLSRFSHEVNYPIFRGVLDLVSRSLR